MLYLSNMHILAVKLRRYSRCAFPVLVVRLNLNDCGSILTLRVAAIVEAKANL